MKLKLLLFNTVKVTSYNFISILLNPPIVLPITNIEGMNTFPLMGFFMEKVKGWLHLDSEKKQGWVLKISPKGVAYVMIYGQRTHLDWPYLTIRYISGIDHYSKYGVEGWLVSGAVIPVTTNRLLLILKELGFVIDGVMTAAMLRSLMAKQTLPKNQESQEECNDSEDDVEGITAA